MTIIARQIIVNNSGTSFRFESEWGGYNNPDGDHHYKIYLEDVIKKTKSPEARRRIRLLRAAVNRVWVHDDYFVMKSAEAEEIYLGLKESKCEQRLKDFFAKVAELKVDLHFHMSG